MAFLRGYYAIHDMETTPKRMGFVPQAGSTTSPVVKADPAALPTTPLPSSDLYAVPSLLDMLDITPLQLLIGLSVFGIVAFAGVFIAIMYCYRMLFVAR